MAEVREMSEDSFEEINAALFKKLPTDQVRRVMEGSVMCDIDPEFLGFVDIYSHLAAVIPTHFTVVDLGCAYAPQAFLFTGHAAYIGVDFMAPRRFAAPNTTHFHMPIAQFIAEQIDAFNLDITFAICSYVPPWQDDNMSLARKHFKNVFTYYPAQTPVSSETQKLEVADQ